MDLFFYVHQPCKVSSIGYIVGSIIQGNDKFSDVESLELFEQGPVVENICLRLVEHREIRGPWHLCPVEVVVQPVSTYVCCHDVQAMASEDQVLRTGVGGLITLGVKLRSCRCRHSPVWQTDAPHQLDLVGWEIVAGRQVTIIGVVGVFDQGQKILVVVHERSCEVDRHPHDPGTIGGPLGGGLQVRGLDLQHCVATGPLWHPLRQGWT
mmetsp:Transcript_130181/g.308865  ORF Transcript_130181/g.308865 Transcript_130181/m.308865 type:complete len:209 (-) Transcript_130181:7731-8357(-)